MKALRFVAALGLACSASAFAADTITATHVFPASLVYSRSFLEFVKKANAAGQGVFSIQVRGGPEAIPMMEQPGAVRSGVVDMIYTACAFYAAQVPECDAVSASTIDGPTARKNGGMDLLNKIHQQRIGVYNLGWVDSGIRFDLWSTKEPKLDSTGHIDIRGFKVRGHPIYNAFLTNYLGAQVINVNSPDLYTALERGTVEITAWTQIGLMDLNWDRYLKYRILPDFFSTDLHILVNLKKWNALSPKTREILQRVTIEHEVSSEAALQQLWQKEKAELERRGIKTIAQSPEASKRFVEGARSASLARMKERMQKAGGMENFERIVELFTPGPLPK
ncbi:MAG TPA: TRAP transporter substrate-binding protein DctP [Burkholderiales bacterium]|nr:TRAP transporter substrate-binding protein DctP [Burkholderiales bacterium]